MADFFAPDEPAPFTIINADSSVPLILICEHASRRIPRRYGDLGIPPEHQGRHLMWDIGMAPITTLLAHRLGVTAVLSNYSRIVLDANRKLTGTSLIPPVSDDLVIPGNQGLSDTERDLRIDHLHRPFHAALDALIDARMSRGEAPAIMGMHSFTPQMAHGAPRPWQAGVLWDAREPRLAVPLMDWLRAHEEGWTVGDNEPYALCDEAGFSIHHHALRRGLPGCAIEVRQDLISTVHGVDDWVNHLSDCFSMLIEQVSG